MIDQPFDLLRTHVRRQAATIEPSTSVDELIAHIIFEHERMPSTFASDPTGPLVPVTSAGRPRRWSSAVVAAAMLIGIGTGAIVTAAIMERGRVTRTDQGVFCHATANRTDGGQVTPLTNDPVGECVRLWSNGQIPDADPNAVPSMAACVGDIGQLEVYPGDSEAICAALGLEPADVNAIADDPQAELGLRILEINERCLSVVDAKQAADELLEELHFEGWHVVIRSGRGACGTIAPSDGEDRTLVVIPISPPD